MTTDMLILLRFRVPRVCTRLRNVFGESFLILKATALVKSNKHCRKHSALGAEHKIMKNAAELVCQFESNRLADIAVEKVF